MDGWNTRSLVRALCTTALGLLLVACGGSGGGADEQRISATFEPRRVSFTGIEGHRYQLSVVARLQYTGQDNLYVVLSEETGLVVDGTLTQVGNALEITLITSDNLPAGVHRSVLLLQACFDEQCMHPVSGSPMRVGLFLELKPQIKIQAPTPMRRVGREAAPSQTLALDFRPEMGTASVTTSGAAQAYDISLQENSLVVNTRQLPAGRYGARVEITGSANPQYKAHVDLDYLVEAPPGGELPLSVTPVAFNLQMPQGTRATHRFQVQRPTWTDALDPLVISDTTVVKDLRHLGNDDYEVTVDTFGVPINPFENAGRWYYSSVLIRAGDHGGRAALSFIVAIDPPLRLTNTDLNWGLDARTVPADLLKSSGVTVPDGSTVRWTATVDQPWVKLNRASGMTGVDDIQLELDRSILDVPGTDQSANLVLTVDQPGTLPFSVPMRVSNYVPRWDMASPGALTGSNARVRIHGVVSQATGLIGSELLQVQGANLVRAGNEWDPRFIGYLGALVLDIDGIVPGQPVTISALSPLRRAQVVLTSPGIPRVPAGYAALPYGRYRAPTYAPGRKMLIFAGTDTVWRWPLSDSSWGTAASFAMPMLLDATLAPDESVIYAATGDAKVSALSVDSFAPLRQGALRFEPGRSNRTFDTESPSGTGVLRFGSDGRAMIAMQPWPQTDTVWGKGAGWLAGCGNIMADIATDPCLADPGTSLSIDPTPIGVALTRSSSGDAIAFSYAAGTSKIYTGIATQLKDGPVMPGGRTIVGVSDSGNWTVRDDGQLSLAGTAQMKNLLAAVPAGHMAGGFGLTGDGKFALVYGYRIADEPSGQRARDANLYMIDLRSGAAALHGTATAAAVVPLSDAVGCTAILTTGETCAHSAQVVVAPGNASAFVLGPRGVAAVALAEPVATSVSEPPSRLLERALDASASGQRR